MSSSNSSSSSCSDEYVDEFHRDILQVGDIVGYQFQPKRDSVSSDESSGSNESDENVSTSMLTDEYQPAARLNNLDW